MTNFSLMFQPSWESDFWNLFKGNQTKRFFTPSQVAFILFQNKLQKPPEFLEQPVLFSSATGEIRSKYIFSKQIETDKCKSAQFSRKWILNDRTRKLFSTKKLFVTTNSFRHCNSPETLICYLFRDQSFGSIINLSGTLFFKTFRVVSLKTNHLHSWLGVKMIIQYIFIYIRLLMISFLNCNLCLSWFYELFLQFDLLMIILMKNIQITRLSLKTWLWKNQNKFFTLIINIKSKQLLFFQTRIQQYCNQWRCIYYCSNKNLISNWFYSYTSFWYTTASSNKVYSKKSWFPKQYICIWKTCI